MLSVINAGATNLSIDLDRGQNRIPNILARESSRASVKRHLRIRMNPSAEPLHLLDVTLLFIALSSELPSSFTSVRGTRLTPEVLLITETSGPQSVTEGLARVEPAIPLAVNSPRDDSRRWPGDGRVASVR